MNYPGYVMWKIGYSNRFLTWWVGHIERFHLAVIALFTLVTLAMLAYLGANFKINADLTNMISDKLPFRQLEKKFSREFPQLTDVIVIVVDADSVGEAMDARQRIAGRLRKEGRLFKSVYEPGGGDFFARNGLLYLNVQELEELSDNLAQGEPLMGLLLRDFSLRSFFSLIGTALDNYGYDSSGKMDTMLDHVGTALTSAAMNRPYRLSWEGIMYGEKESSDQRRQFIIIRPVLGKNGLIMGAPPADAMHRIISGLRFDDSIKIRLTGDVLLAYENVSTARQSVGIATFVSLLLVGLVIFIGLGSGRLVFAGFATLITGLIWTTGFATIAIGSLNLISTTFTMLFFVGLGIDYGIQFCLRYRELVEAGRDNRECLITTANGVGTGLFLSCTATAFGFFAFLPTAYSGIAQLGLISGTGMFISFFCNLTLLPALLTFIRFRNGIAPTLFSKMAITKLPYRYYRAITAVALVLGLCAAATIPRVYFDHNPINLYNPASESITTLKDLFKNKQAPPWTISVLCGGKQSALELTEKLGRLKEVKAAISVFDFVPGEQPEKLNIISNIALFMPGSEHLHMNRLPYGENMAALNSLETRLAKFLEGDPGPSTRHIVKLLESLRKFKIYVQTSGNGEVAFSELQNSLLSGLPALLKRLDTMLQPTSVKEADLPRDLVREYVSPAGHYRVQVFPREDIMNVDALARFVTAVKSVAPNAVDTPVTVYETGKAIASSFRVASLLALAAVVVVLFVALRSLFATAMVLIPLFLAIILTAATSVIFDLPLNFANVIVLPLLLGVGVHNGIMFMLRYLTEPPADGNLLNTSTARAVLFGNLTMIISSATLAFSSHRGIASMGILLSVCSAFILVSILVVFPALLKLSVQIAPESDKCPPESQ
jgi:hopanoid biosynthesis associated RND transporter like protein HpnN